MVTIGIFFKIWDKSTFFIVTKCEAISETNKICEIEKLQLIFSSLLSSNKFLEEATGMREVFLINGFIFKRRI